MKLPKNRERSLFRAAWAARNAPSRFLPRSLISDERASHEIKAHNSAHSCGGSVSFRLQYRETGFFRHVIGIRVIPSGGNAAVDGSPHVNRHGTGSDRWNHAGHRDVPRNDGACGNDGNTDGSPQTTAPPATTGKVTKPPKQTTPPPSTAPQEPVPCSSDNEKLAE